MKERELIKKTLLCHTDKILFRNKIGLGYTKTGKPIRYGLKRGSADLIGWKSIEITPEMVGQKIAIFCGIEIKTKNDRLSKDQICFLEALKKDGGIAEVVKEE